MVEMRRECTGESRWQKQPSELRRVGARTEGRQGRVSAFPRVDDAGGRVERTRTPPLCARRSVTFLTRADSIPDICPTRGYKWARPT